MKETDKAYIAGLVDGEAYIGIKKSKPYKCTGRISPGYSERIQIRMVDEEAIRFVAESLGGWYYKEKPNAKRGRSLYCFQASDLKAVKILEVILPYLRIKREQALTALRLRDNKSLPKSQLMAKRRRMIQSRWGQPIEVFREYLSEDTINHREALWQRCKSLNKVGVG